jgi:hypothetical protein
VSKAFVILVSWRFVVAASSKEHIEALNEKNVNTTFGMSLCVVGWMNTNLSEKHDASIKYEDHNPRI